MATQTRSEARRERILEAALEVFSTRGYRQAQMEEIASGSGTSKGGLYFHFPSKERLFLALLDRTARQLMGKVERAVAGVDEPLDRIDRGLEVVLDTFASHRFVARLFLIEAMGAGAVFHRRLLEIRRGFADWIAGHLEEAMAAGAIDPVDPRLAAKIWFGGLNEVVTLWLLEKEPRPLAADYPALRALLRRSVGLESPAEAGP